MNKIIDKYEMTYVCTYLREIVFCPPKHLPLQIVAIALNFEYFFIFNLADVFHKST